MNNEDDLVPQNDYATDWHAVFQPQLSTERSADNFGRQRDDIEAARFAEFSSAGLSVNELSALQGLEKGVLDNTMISGDGEFSPQKSAAALGNYDYANDSGHLSNARVRPATIGEGNGTKVGRKEVSIWIKIVRQPELQHRARYLSEGSRGAIKDRTGSSNCTVQLIGYHRPTRVQLVAVLGSDNIDGASGGGRVTVTPHPLYRLIPVSGKTSSVSSCQKVVGDDGMECIEVMLYPENNMTAVLDCIGILKICTYDTKHRKRKSNAAMNNSASDAAANNNSAAMQNSVRIFMRSHIPADAFGGVRTVYAITDPISCDGTLKWTAEAQIDKQYLHQCHIVCTVPPYEKVQSGGEVSLAVVCATKSSQPQSFVYSACNDEDDDWRPPGSPQMNNMFCLPDYDAESHRNLALLERSYCPSAYYDGSLTSTGTLSVTVPCTKADLSHQNIDDLVPSHRNSGIRTISGGGSVNPAVTRILNDLITSNTHHQPPHHQHQQHHFHDAQHQSNVSQHQLHTNRQHQQPVHHPSSHHSHSIHDVDSSTSQPHHHYQTRHAIHTMSSSAGGNIFVSATNTEAFDQSGSLKSRHPSRS